MNTRLLKINAMKRFNKWLSTRNVAAYLWGLYNPVGKIYAGLERRQAEADARDKFIDERSKKRNSWKWMFMRQNQDIIGNRLLGYIQTRYERKKNGHK